MYVTIIKDGTSRGVVLKSTDIGDHIDKLVGYQHMLEKESRHNICEWCEYKFSVSDLQPSDPMYARFCNEVCADAYMTDRLENIYSKEQ